MSADPAIRIAIVAYPGAQEAAVLGLADLFTVANQYVRQAGRRPFSVDRLEADGLDASAPPDSVILPPNLSGKRGADAPQMHAWLRDCRAAGTVVCSACAGAFWLGHAGLLEGRAATTHWALEGEFRAAFPGVELLPDQLLVDGHDIVTAGGVMAWIDLGLHLVQRWLGPEIMSATARHLLVDPAGREQRNYRTFRPVLSHGDAPVLAVQHWLEARVREDLTVGDMAAQAGLTGRTFLRRFRSATGLAPLAYLQNLRIEKARGLLERTRLPVDEIAWQVGYADVSAFTRLFRTLTGLPPGTYRRRFRTETGV
ncbi:helix-turn-helix domain-containing protein [Thalassobaculum sp. OXR-137]|uniref:GlxA family transcriptional regulator n=1 Tax=Thalassobaculum sp. OXR-137 TaxID=3100173 RepID=UPI002AC913BE|nr:helix-turn-helix domain-containing protein [Thalassobaculum sp. OXR-137]WPZ32766.1 helix-turn-helix domain-containing protein [Thalassobaculum sp. OXR-137]